VARPRAARPLPLGELFATTGDQRRLAPGGADPSKHLYAVNARFGTTDPQPAKYNVVRVP
jgi:hypothetical protein